MLSAWLKNLLIVCYNETEKWRCFRKKKQYKNKECSFPKINVILVCGESYRNRDYLEFGSVAMVTLRDWCSLRVNLVILFYTRALCTFGKTKDVFRKSFWLQRQDRRMMFWKSLKLFSLVIHHINVILDRIEYNFWNGSIFISFCRFCWKSNFWKTSEAIEYKNFTNLHKKISGILTPASLNERIQSLLDWINE